MFMKVCDRQYKRYVNMELMWTLEAMVEFKRRFIFIEEFMIYVMHIVDDYKLQVNFEVIVI
jgi:hypothetical protein